MRDVGTGAKHAARRAAARCHGAARRGAERGGRGALRLVAVSHQARRCSAKWRGATRRCLLCRFSDDDNKFFVIGCNTVAYVIQDDSSVRGCMSECPPEQSLNNDSCSGYGCCKTEIRSLSSYKLFFNKSYNSTEEWRYRSRCSYVMVMEEAALDYSTTYIDSTTFYDTRKGQVPAVMDWAIGRYACKAARLNGTSYACVGRNTECVDTSIGQGYLCNCSSGYEGNPYTVEGCKDINECLDVEKYPCPGICKNTPGSYTCSCPPGEALIYTPIGDVVVTSCMAPTTRTKWSGSVVIIILASAIAFLLLALGAIVLNKKLKAKKARKLKEKNFKKNRGLLLQQLVDKDIAEKMLFSLDELEKATNNFDETRKIGRGGHGTVYKGILLNQQVVAVKKSKITVQSEIDGFINEVAVLSTINHRNIIKLVGCCLETECPLLVYEFISNGTLSQHLHVEGPQALSWRDRLNIAVAVANALTYLHSSSSIPIVHRDIKTENILLDHCLTPKVSDFGTSRQIPVDKTGVTTGVQGTFGYLDPEYYHTRRLTEKSDVYSFGAVLVELLTRKKPFLFLSSAQIGLVSHFNSLISLDKISEILDPQVMLEAGKDAETVAGLAATCLALKGDERPTMRQVETRLRELLATRRNNNINNKNVAEQNNVSREFPAQPISVQKRKQTKVCRPKGSVLHIDENVIQDINKRGRMDSEVSPLTDTMFSRADTGGCVVHVARHFDGDKLKLPVTKRQCI